jgi:two-component system phosphate regulon sensor histidine kinase PhoR
MNRRPERPLHRFSRSLQIGLLFMYGLTLITVFFATHQLTRSLMINHLYIQAKEILKDLPDNGHEEELLEFLALQKQKLFFRVTLLSDDLIILYDSQQKTPDPYHLQDYRALVEARRYGYSYDEHFSSVTMRSMSYISVRFEYGGGYYLLRCSFPLDPIQTLKEKLQITFVLMNSVTFLIFSLLTWMLIRRLNRPLEELLKTISQKSIDILNPSAGATLIEIRDLPKDFDDLVQTLNGLSSKFNTTLKMLAAERNAREAILRSMAEGVLSLNGDLSIVYANPAAYQILDLVQGEKSSLLALHHSRYDRLRTLCLDCLHEQAPLMEEIELNLGNRRVFLDILVNPGLSGGINLLVRDKSQQHELNEMRKSFVTNASHELRTPITIIRGFAETIVDHPEGISKEMLHDIMEKVVSNCERMNTLITHLMNLSKVENLPLQDLKPVNLISTIETILEMMNQVHSKAILEFKKEVQHPTVIGQEVLLGIAIRNLIENAIKYCENVPHICISLIEQEEFLELTVTDNGIGIPQTDLPYIFERFYRVDKARSKKTGGYGLGLSMVKTIIDKHGASIQVDSTLGQGTQFKIRFPLYHGEKELESAHY